MPSNRCLCTFDWSHLWFDVMSDKSSDGVTHRWKNIVRRKSCHELMTHASNVASWRCCAAKIHFWPFEIACKQIIQRNMFSKSFNCCFGNSFVLQHWISLLLRIARYLHIQQLKEKQFPQQIPTCCSQQLCFRRKFPFSINFINCDESDTLFLWHFGRGTLQ